jgi:hypothetical protein
VVREAQDAGVWIFGGGVERQRASIVAADGKVTAGPYPETKAVIGGFVIVDVPSREEAGGRRSTRIQQVRRTQRPRSATAGVEQLEPRAREAGARYPTIRTTGGACAIVHRAADARRDGTERAGNEHRSGRDDLVTVGAVVWRHRRPTPGG